MSCGWRRERRHVAAERKFNLLMHPYHTSFSVAAARFDWSGQASSVLLRILLRSLFVLKRSSIGYLQPPRLPRAVRSLIWPTPQFSRSINIRPDSSSFFWPHTHTLPLILWGVWWDARMPVMIELHCIATYWQVQQSSDYYIARLGSLYRSPGKCN